MAEHKSLTSQSDAAIFLDLIESGVPATMLTAMVNKGFTAERIAELHDGHGNIIEPGDDDK